MTREFTDILTFAREHRDEDPIKLLLQQQRYPDIDMGLVVQQLEGHRQASAKWPTLGNCEGYFFPPKLNREQSSSEATARFKAHLFDQLGRGTFADLTGGMGVDTYFISLLASQTTYFELNPPLYSITCQNFEALGKKDIVCHNVDSIEYLRQHFEQYDTMLIDPARRDRQGNKVAAFEDCTPNLLDNLVLLCNRCRHLIVKASPMIDLHQAVNQLGSVADIHIVAVNNECKEVLFLFSDTSTAEPTIYCHNLPYATSQHFTWTEEESATPLFATTVGKYLYEPNVALMKGGCYRLLSQRFGIHQLARNTHLYTTDRLIADFPGRRFEVLQEVPLNAKKIRSVVPNGHAHVVTRNYPISAPQLQQRLKLLEGGDLFVIAATLCTKPAGWLCKVV